MRVARNCRKRRSLRLRISSPTSLMLPPDGTSEPFCSSPITVSDVTDLPDPLSPTRHSVSRSRTCSETPSMMRSWRVLVLRPTTRSSMSRTGAVMSSPVQHRHCEELLQRSNPFFSFFPRRYGLLRFAHNDVEGPSLAALALLHAGIERV